MVATEFSYENLVHNGTIHNAIFSHPDIYAQELEQIFARCWLFVGHESQIPNRGDFVRSRMGEEQVIVTRAPDNKIHVLLNSCAHRGNVVCRYDQGFALSFQCSFHGWTYAPDGRLLAVAPNAEELYTPDLKKEEWGLLQARVETFQGTIWATWDQSAPTLIEYLGGAEAYMEPPLCDADGTPNGAEVAGGVMKWRVGMNWKIPMPDNDNTHFWITHKSTFVNRGQGSGGSGAPRPRGQSYHVWFPEGHTTSMTVPEEQTEASDNLFVGGGGEYPMMRDYIVAKYPARQQRLGKLVDINEIPHVFPNVGAVGRIIRVMHPQGPAETEMWSWVLVDKAAPPEVKEAAARYHERNWGPNGYVQKDDMENWYIQTQYSKGTMTRSRLRTNAQLGMSTPSIDGPTRFGLPGQFHPAPTDANIRAFYERWAQVMAARDWDELLAKSRAR